MKNKYKELSIIKFAINLCIFETTCSDRHSLFFKCKRLKKAKKIFNVWFFNNAINVQLTQGREIHKMSYTKGLAAC